VVVRALFATSDDETSRPILEEDSFIGAYAVTYVEFGKLIREAVTL